MTKKGRLIDTDEQKSQLYEATLVNEDMDCLDFLRIASLIDAQPTAYDVDKVVEQMEEFRDEMKMFGCDGLLSDLIEVVKGGGVDDN